MHVIALSCCIFNSSDELKTQHEMEPIMKKNIATAVTVIAAFVAIGTAGALECDTITMTEALIRLAVCCAAIFLCSGDIMD